MNIDDYRENINVLISNISSALLEILIFHQNDGNVVGFRILAKKFQTYQEKSYYRYKDIKMTFTELWTKMEFMRIN